MELGEDADLNCSQSNLAIGINELASGTEGKKENEFSQDMEDNTQKECNIQDEGTIKKYQVCKDEHKPTRRSCSKDEKAVTIDESIFIKFRNNFFEVGSCARWENMVVSY